MKALSMAAWMVAAGTDGSKIWTLGPKLGVFEVGRVVEEDPPELELATVAFAWFDAGDDPNASTASTT